MYLRRLEVHGFKAFADRQRFEFGPGMTVVVGPNGSGKSNVADAIRWALGEQSARQIRARKTEDVIFSGSERRRPMGMAEVTLVLDNAEGWMPIEFSEVAVTRRAHRSGENEYLINGQNVRLTDVLDLFRRAQVGQNSYAHMSQGLVDEVLALRPSERRELIEEAADLRRHRHQLTLSERRLAETRENLANVHMLIREVEPRLRSLARQSRRASQYQQLAAELSDALQVYYEAELRRMRGAQAAERAAQDERSRRFAEAQREMESLESRLRDLGGALEARRAELGRLQAREREQAEEGLRLEQAVALAQQRLEWLGARRRELEAAVAAADADLGGGAAEGGAAGAGDPEEAAAARELAALEEQVQAARARLDRERQALASAEEDARAVVRQLAEVEARRTRLESERDAIVQRLSEHQAGLEQRERARARAVERRAELLERLRAHGRGVLEHRRAAAALAAAFEQTRREREAAEARLEEVQGAERAASEAVRDLEASLAQQEERVRLIEAMRDSIPAGGGAQALIEAARDPAGGVSDASLPGGVIDAVARLIRVPAGLEVAIEAALAEHLSSVAVEREQDAFAAVEYLRREGAGTAILYPLDTLASHPPRDPAGPTGGPGTPDTAGIPGVVGVAAQLVSAEPRFRPLVDAVLGQVVVVEDVAAARQVVRRGRGPAVTRDGVLLRADGSIFGGRGAGTPGERFALERELETLPAEIERTQAAVEVARSRAGEAERALAAAREAVTQARRAVDEAERRRDEHAAGEAALQQGRTALAAAMRDVRRAIRAAEDESATLADLRGERDAVQQALADASTQAEAVRDRSDGVRQRRDAIAERAAAATQALASVEAEHRLLVQQREERAEARRRLRAQQEERRGQLAALVREQEELERTLQERRDALERHRGGLADARDAIEPAQAALASLQQEERALAAHRRERQEALLAAERALLKGEAALRERASLLERLLEQVTDDGMRLLDDGRVVPQEPAPAEDEDGDGDGATGMDDGGRGERDGDVAHAPAPQATAFHVAAPDAGMLARPDEPSDGRDGAGADGEPGVGVERTGAVAGGAEVDTEALHERITELKGRIRSLGPVNLDALDEMTAEQERYEFLTGQVADLEAAEQELRGAIRELKRLISSRFAETFEVVNVRFGEYFTRFFGGGQAELRLLEGAAEEGEEAEPGVEIFAQPPGKRIANLSVLSGGERSMTSVALLFALLSVNPAPMVVLDEVDAALDEANVGRFVDTLAELRDRSQFIVISHNRRTIEAADALYGVSMADDSTSQVLSMRLAELSRAS